MAAPYGRTKLTLLGEMGWLPPSFLQTASRLCQDCGVETPHEEEDGKMQNMMIGV